MLTADVYLTSIWALVIDRQKRNLDNCQPSAINYGDNPLVLSVSLSIQRLLPPSWSWPQSTS
jgi:hypothetical protein